MRLAVHHQTVIESPEPTFGIITVLRLTPRDHEGHYVCDWSIDVDVDCDLETSKDAFGNTVTSFSIPRAVERITVTASGDVETEDTHGIVRGTHEAIPLGVYQRRSHLEPMAKGSRALLTAAQAIGPKATNAAREPLAILHGLMQTLYEATGDNESESAQTGSNHQRQSMGDGRDLRDLTQRIAVLLDGHDQPSSYGLASLFCDAAKSLGFASRMASGYIVSEERLNASNPQMTSMDIWAEAYVESLGWVGFDPANNHCPSEEAVRVAVGIDETAIQPVRAAAYSAGARLHQETAIRVSNARR